MGQVAVVDPAVVWPQVAAQLAADRGWGATEPASDLPYGQPAAAQGGDPLPLQQREEPARAGGLGQPGRWQAAVLRSPPVAGLATDAQQLARRHGADARLQQLPVLGLQIQLTLPASPSHPHTPKLPGVLRQLLEPALPPGGQFSGAIDTSRVGKQLGINPETLRISRAQRAAGLSSALSGYAA